MTETPKSLHGNRFVVSGALSSPGAYAVALDCHDTLQQMRVVCRYAIRDGLCKEFREQFLFLARSATPLFPAAYGLFEDSETGRPFISMERIHGQDAEEWLRTRERSTLERAAVAAATLDACSRLQNAGSEHGDLHLRNVMVCGRDAHVVLIDPAAKMWGRTRAPPERNEVPDLDAASELLADLKLDPDIPPIASVYAAIRDKRSLALAAKEARQALSSPALFNLESLEDASAYLGSDIAARLSEFEHLSRLRWQGIRHLCEILEACVSSGLGRPSSRGAGVLRVSSHFDHSELAQQELDTVSSDRSRLLGFTVRIITSEEGRGVLFQLESSDDFLRPWPASEASQLGTIKVSSITGPSAVTHLGVVSIRRQSDSETELVLQADGRDDVLLTPGWVMSQVVRTAQHRPGSLEALREYLGEEWDDEDRIRYVEDVADASARLVQLPHDALRLLATLVAIAEPERGGRPEGRLVALHSEVAGVMNETSKRVGDSVAILTRHDAAEGVHDEETGQSLIYLGEFGLQWGLWDALKEISSTERVLRDAICSGDFTILS